MLFIEIETLLHLLAVLYQVDGAVLGIITYEASVIGIPLRG